MSELPERKVLKEILMKLKRKTMTSIESYKKASLQISRIFAGAFERELERESPLPQKATLVILSTLEDTVKMLILSMGGVIDDLRLYIEALEHYSGELDKTLWDAIEQTRKEAEEQIKQQEELRKKEPTYRA